MALFQDTVYSDLFFAYTLIIIVICLYFLSREATLLAIKQVVLLALQERLAQTQIPMKLLLVCQGNIQLGVKQYVYSHAFLFSGKLNVKHM